MVKQMIAIVVLSVLVVMGTLYAQQLLHALLAAHDWIAESLTQIFSGGEAGNLTRQLIALLSVPLLVGVIPAAAYWMLKRGAFPYFMEFVWATWLVQAAAIIMMYKG